MLIQKTLFNLIIFVYLLCFSFFNYGLCTEEILHIANQMKNSNLTNKFLTESEMSFFNC